MNSGGAVRGSIYPGWILGRTRRRRLHSVSSPYPGKSPLPASRQGARPPTETIYSRPRKKPSAGRCRCPHRQGQCSCRPHSYSTPAVSGHWPVSSALVSCVRRLRSNGGSVIWIFYHASLRLFSVDVLPTASGQLVARSHLWTQCPEVGSSAVLPPPDIPFRTVILFSRCCPSMNYPKSTRKKCNPRNFARIAF